MNLELHNTLAELVQQHGAKTIQDHLDFLAEVDMEVQAELEFEAVALQVAAERTLQRAGLLEVTP